MHEKLFANITWQKRVTNTEAHLLLSWNSFVSSTIIAIIAAPAASRQISSRIWLAAILINSFWTSGLVYLAFEGNVRNCSPKSESAVDSKERSSRKFPRLHDSSFSFAWGGARITFGGLQPPKPRPGYVPDHPVKWQNDQCFLVFAQSEDDLLGYRSVWSDI